MSTPEAKAGFVDRISGLVAKVRYRYAGTPAERDAIFRLRYDGYRREDLIPAHFSRRLVDQYDDLENAWLFGIHIDDVLVASIRLHVLSRAHPQSPAMSFYPDIVTPWLDDNQTIVDPNRFVIDSVAAKSYPELPYLTLRLACVATEYFEATQTLATVRTEHQAFYRRVFGQHPVSEPRTFPGYFAAPIALMTMDVHEMRARLYQRYPFFQSSPAERLALFGRRMRVAEPLPELVGTPSLVPAEAARQAGHAMAG